jgi:hypothetical protein
MLDYLLSTRARELGGIRFFTAREIPSVFMNILVFI